jgi:N-methylhydantoinase A/oxoprolinase/acetone carboxylase beta subunit|tara:strand:- start:45 stop:1577 length:1533 start_codon:yes stop_codon:yes gene_type:complete
MRRIGIDVGGTNTDGALLDGERVIETIKTPTTSDVLGGIRTALDGVSHHDIGAVIIGTTQFTNAVVQRTNLNRVGFLRIGLPAGRSLPPLSSWPTDLAEVVRGETFLVRGGIEYDGRPFEELDEQAVIEAARQFADNGINAIVVSGSFSPIDTRQETRAAELITEHHPQAQITVSHRLGQLGLLERENAAGLNACLLELAESIIAAFAAAIDQAGLGSHTRLFLTQNNGTLLKVEEAAKYPVLTFASGPTNSMRGAAALGEVDDGLVVDVGGTTADFGALVSGYPRQANAAVEVGGVRTLFQLPDVLSIGLGGGSRIHLNPLRLGPDSVGQQLSAQALAFGGSVPTLTDAAIAEGVLRVEGTSRPELTNADEVLSHAATMVADGADRMKLSSMEVPLIAVGGGAFAVADAMDGISEVVRPLHGDTANAIGAALAEVSGVTDRVFHDIGHDAAVAEGVRLATEDAVASGADPTGIEVIEVEDLPLAYLPGDARRVRVRVVGPLESVDRPKG